MLFLEVIDMKPDYDYKLLKVELRPPPKKNLTEKRKKKWSRKLGSL